MDVRFCEHCDASLTPEASFCGNCGAETPKRKREHRIAARETHRGLKAAARSIVWIFTGSLLGMVLASLLFETEVVAYLVFCAIALAICALAVRSLGPGSFRFSFGRKPDGPGIALGVTLPVASLLIASGYAWLLQKLFPESASPPVHPYGMLAMLVLFAVMPAFVEEWMCRGVLWIALRPIVSRAATIFVTAALFGALHGLNGGFTLEMPHRFAMGLLLGWLRAHTASLWPCVLAHFLHNAVAFGFLQG